MTIHHRGTEITENGEKEQDPLSGSVVGAAIEVHRFLGPGLLESAYEACLAKELALRGISFEQQVPLPLDYKGIRVEAGYRLDFVVDQKLVVELKAVDRLDPIHEAQVLTCLRLSGLRVGLLINFNVPVLVRGVKRLING